MTIGDLKFQCVVEQDIPMLESLIRQSQYQESNHNVLNLFMWKSWFPLWKHVAENYVLLLGIHLGKYFLYMPLCEEQSMDEALQAGCSLLKHAGVPFHLSCYTEDVKNKVIQLLPHLEVIELRDGFDYIYQKEKLITLSGKKLQKRRNHLNSFMKQNGDDVSYVDIQEHLDGCLAFLSKWKPESEDDYLMHEREGTEYLLTHWSMFSAYGGCVLIRGEVEGFIIGSYGNESTVQINVEKANDSYRGIYQYLEKEFLSRNFLDAVWVNREDDMGLQNLRKAKLANQPEYLVKKYQLLER